jgi:signal transduction histidine kinase/ligand-binding sensor domain-containing protein
MRFSALCWGFVLSFALVKTFAQTIIPRFEAYGVNEGLSQSSVYSIHQDRKGFMWFGTADGLNRFDGHAIKVFRGKNTDGTPANFNFIRGALIEDRKGNIWFSNETGIYYFDPVNEEIKSDLVFKGKHYHGVHALITSDAKNDIWLGTASGLIRYSPADKSSVEYPFPFEYSQYQMAVAHELVGNCIMISVLGHFGILRFDLTTKKFDWIFVHLERPAVAKGKNKLLLVTISSVSYYDSLTNKVIPIPVKTEAGALQNIRCIIEDPFGRLWIGTLGYGIYCYDMSTGQTVSFRHNNSKSKSLPIDITTRLFVDRTNNLWVGTDGAGVAKLDLKPPRFNLFPLNEGDYPLLNDYFIKCFYEDDKGRVWFGTHNNGFNIFSPTTGELKNYSDKKGANKFFPGTIVGGILRDTSGKMWIGHNRGLSIFDPEHETTRNITIHPTLPDGYWINLVYAIRQFASGRIIVSTFYGMVTVDYPDNPEGRLHNYTPYLSLAVTDAIEMPDSTIWYVSPVNGLYHVRYENQKFQLIEKFLEGIDFRSMHPDERNNKILWIASGKGLIKFNIVTKEHQIFNEKDGFGNGYIYGILEDSDHRFWLSTNRGITCFNPDSLTVQNFTANDGLQSNEFNTGSFYKGNSGTLYFGGVKGFNWFKPDNKILKTVKPGVAVTSVMVNSSVFSKDSIFFYGHKMVLPFNRNNLEFEFAALDFSKPQANKIQYRLDNWDKEWVTTNFLNARYANMPAGEYLLRVKASNSVGIWSDEEQIKIIILAPFWRSSWFYLFLGLITIATIIIATQRFTQRKVEVKMRELEKQAAIISERLRISKDMHDEIGSGLTHIALLSELSATQSRVEVEMKQDIETISGTAQKLVQSMGEIIWAINPQNDTLENLMAYIREQTHNYFEPFSIQYTVDFPEEVPEVRLSNVQRRNIFLVTKEALNNALKHSNGTCIRLSMQVSEKAVHFRVEDNGVGVKQEKTRPYSNGMKNMNSRINELGGFIEIFPGEIGGTVVQFNVPI